MTRTEESRARAPPPGQKHYPQPVGSPAWLRGPAPPCAGRDGWRVRRGTRGVSAAEDEAVGRELPGSEWGWSG
eukprot:196102-Rhodomonas_salina.1